MKALRENETSTVWIDTEDSPQFLPLLESLKVDVCIVGGGIGGLTTAYLLMKEGKKVCVLEDFEIGGGQTGRTTAHFANALDERYFEIEKYFGKEGAKIAAQSHTAAIKKVSDIVQREDIQCELETVDGYLFAAEDDRPGILQKELEAVHEAGLTEVELVESSPINSFSTGPCLKFPQQVQLHPLKYINGLARCIVKGGGHIFTNTHVDEIQGGNKAYVKARDHIVECDSIVVATNTPINDLFAIHTKQAPYRTYVLGFKIPKASISKALYWDTLDPYHYIRIEGRGDHDVLIVGGEDHKTGQETHPETCFAKLERWSRIRFPMIKDIVYSWSGQVMEPVDGLGFLGHNPLDKNNVYIITGDSGNGMTHCTIGGMLITDQIMGRKNEWENLYNPSRVNVLAAPEFLKENANVIAQYGDWFSIKPKAHLVDLPLGEGTVVRDGLKMVAVYKDPQGEVEMMSAVCTHLGGIVTWNKLEKSWDCPCHGSRFDCHGKVIEGPAFRDLKQIQDEQISDELYRKTLLKS